MTTVSSRLAAEIEDLVIAGTKITRRVSTADQHLDGDALSEVTTWVTRLGQLVRKLYGERSQHFVSYTKAADTHGFFNLWKNHYTHFTHMLGVAKTIKHEVDNNLLVDVKALLQADIFADFLEMGEHLLQESYKDAAAVIIGTVLEDKLRGLTLAAGLPIRSDSGKPMTIEPLNIQLTKNDVYSTLVQKQVTTWAHIRNKAAHGEYSEYTKQQVEMMLVFVQGFVAEHSK